MGLAAVRRRSSLEKRDNSHRLAAGASVRGPHPMTSRFSFRRSTGIHFCPFVQFRWPSPRHKISRDRRAPVRSLHTFKKASWRSFARVRKPTQRKCGAKSFRIRSYRKCRAKSFRIRSYENTWGVGAPFSQNSHLMRLPITSRRLFYAVRSVPQP